MEHANYPTLRELLRQDVFSNSRVLSGGNTLDVPVVGVNLTDTPDYYDWISPHELLITNCYSIHNDEAVLSTFIGCLAEKELAGVCIKPSRFLGTIPEYMISAAKELSFPLIELPPSVRFADITKAVSDELLRRQTALLHNSISVNQMLLQTITEGASLEDLAQRVREIAGGSVLLVNAINQRQAYSLSETDAVRLASLDRDALCHVLSEEADAHEMRIDGYLFGTVFLCRIEGRPPLHEDILSQILQTIPLEISREHSVRKTESRSFTEFFQHLISDRILDDNWEQFRANAFHLDLSAPHALLELNFQPNSSISEYAAAFQRTAFFHVLRQSLERLDIDTHIMDHPDGCLILMNSKENPASLDQALVRLPAAFEALRARYPSLAPTGGCSRSHTGIPFPIPRDQYAHCMELLEALEIGDAVKADCKVEEVDSFFSVLKRAEMLTVNVEELNYLAKRLDSFDTSEAAQFQAMAHKLELFELKDLINLTFCCQQATVITDFSDLAAVGRDHYMNLHGGSASVDELNKLDGEETARRLIENGGGTITPTAWSTTTA